jgi:CheY-like chemotaxis protein
MVFVGERDHLLELEPAVEGMAGQVLMDSWQPEEALVRLSVAILDQRRTLPRWPKRQYGRGSDETAVARLLIACEDASTSSLVQSALENCDLQCEQASDAPSALEAICKSRPQLAVLDAGRDGFDMLASIRKENLPVRVLLLIPHQKETEVIRGFLLGADDYLATPFSSLELEARVQRLL